MIVLADDGAPAAEICRRVGEAAERLGLSRPSYEQVRVLVNERRAQQPTPSRRVSQVSGWELLTDIVWRARPATDIDPWFYNEPLPYRPGAHNEPRK